MKCRFGDRSQLFGQQQDQDWAHHLAFSAADIVQHPTHEVLFVRQNTVEKLHIARQLFGNRLFNAFKLSHFLENMQSQRSSARLVGRFSPYKPKPRPAIYATKVQKNEQSADYNAYF